jgi:holo-[acyl-carrier protein] synthase
MEIIALGTDIVECLRIRRLIERHGELFLNRAFTEREVRHCQSGRHPTERFAALWAVKQAVWKCLGPARRPEAGWADVEVQVEPNAPPKVRLRGAARERADDLGVTDVLIALAHCRAYATATATAVRRTNG